MFKRFSFYYNPNDRFWHGFGFCRRNGSIYIDCGIFSIDKYSTIVTWTFYFWKWSIEYTGRVS